MYGTPVPILTLKFSSLGPDTTIESHGGAAGMSWNLNTD